MALIHIPNSEYIAEAVRRFHERLAAARVPLYECGAYMGTPEVGYGHYNWHRRRGEDACEKALAGVAAASYIRNHGSLEGWEYKNCRSRRRESIVRLQDARPADEVCNLTGRSHRFWECSTFAGARKDSRSGEPVGI